MATIFRPPSYSPPAPRPTAALHLCVASALVLLAGAAPVAAPFAQTDWPNPRSAAPLSSLRTFTDSTRLLLAGKDTFFAGPGQGPDYDYPNPRGPVPHRELRTFTLGVNLTLLSKDQQFQAAGQWRAYDWPNPLNRGAASDLRTWTLNLQETTLAPIVAAAQPFAQSEWPNPRVPVPARQAFTNPSEIQLFGQDQVYGASGQVPDYDYPLPQGRPSLIALRTFTDGRKAFHVDLTPANQFDWPNPQGKAYPVGLTTCLNTRQPYHVDLTPANLTDWPNPRGPVYPVALRTALDSRKAYHADLATTAVADWPLPARARPSSVVTDPPNLLGTTLASTAAPFGLSDWLVPRGVSVLISLKTQIGAVNLLAGKDQFFSAAGQGPDYDYPNPQGRSFPIALRTWTLGLQETTLVPSGAPPFIPVAFDNPRAKEHPIVLRTWTDGRKAFHVDLTPAHLTDWPITRVRLSALDLLTSADNRLQTTLNPQPPFTQGDWPNPTGRIASIALKTALDSRKPYHVDITPAALRDWPIARGKAFPHELRTWLQNLLGSTLAPDVLPFATEWPLPTGKVASRALRTHLHAVVLELLGRDQFFSASGIGPNYDYPNPRGREAFSDLRMWTQSVSFVAIQSLSPAFADYIISVRGDVFTIDVREDVATIKVRADVDEVDL